MSEWTAHEIATLKTMYEKFSVKDIALSLGRSLGAVYVQSHRQGIAYAGTRRKKSLRLSPVEREARAVVVDRYIDLHGTLMGASRALGVSPGCISMWRTRARPVSDTYYKAMEAEL